MAKKPSGRRRADVQINVFEQFELRSRRSLIEAERKKASRSVRRAERRAARMAERELKLANSQAKIQLSNDNVVRQVITSSSKPQKIRRLTTISVALGMFTTTVLPAYAFSPDVAAMSRFTTTDAVSVANSADTQDLTVAAVNLSKFVRNSAKSVSAEALFRSQLRSLIAMDKSPKIAALLETPEFTTLDPVQIMAVAARFEGTPYAFGGDSPAAFDCSGYVAYVFAHFGVALPHSVHGQNLLGKQIKAENARPGDLVIFNDLSHDGIYAGNGNFWHAPRRGDRVKLAPIYSSNIHFVRITKDN